MGCGPQEQFRGCADIAIGDDFTTEGLIHEHENTPVTMVTNKVPQDDNDGNYINYKDAVNSIQFPRNYRRKWWKSNEGKGEEADDDNEAKILFETLFKNRCCGLSQCTVNILLLFSFLLLIHL